MIISTPWLISQNSHSVFLSVFLSLCLSLSLSFCLSLSLFLYLSPSFSLSLSLSFSLVLSRSLSLFLPSLSLSLSLSIKVILLMQIYGRFRPCFYATVLKRILKARSINNSISYEGKLMRHDIIQHKISML